MHLKLNLETVVCRTQTDRNAFGGDADEFYVIKSVGDGVDYTKIEEQTIGDFERGNDRRIDLTIYDGDINTVSRPYVRFAFQDSDVGEPQYGENDFIGAFTISVDNNGGVHYSAGEQTDDKGRTDSGAQEFLLHGSGSDYTIYVKEQIS